MRLFSLAYDLFLHLYVCASLPKIVRDWPKYKNNFWKRLGVGFPHIEKNGRPLVWIHGVSLGETKAAAPLVKRLKSLQNPPLIVLSTTTETGHAEGLKNAPLADFHLFLPFDFSYIIRPIIKRIAPDLVILTETDFWYHFQEAAKKVGAQLIVINGKISQRSFNRLGKFPFIAKRVLSSIDHFYLQGDLHRDRFAQLKIPPSKLTVTGNLKLDAEIGVCDIPSLKKQLGITNQPILTLGSTHDPEERIWIGALKQLWSTFPDLKVLIAPRHPERFDAVAQLLFSHALPFTRWSENGTFHTSSILLVDGMGLLKKCYQISDLAFVGGSFTPKIGGHNILEPLFYGKPVLFGPYMHSQPDLLELVNVYQAGLQIRPETIALTLQKLLTTPALCFQIGSNGLKLINSSRGALEHTFNLLQKHLPC